LFRSPSLINHIVQIAIWGVLLKYSYAALKATARGDLVPPKIDSKSISDDFHQVFKQLGIFISIFLGFILVQQFVGVIFAVLFLVAAILFVPAMIIIFVTTESLMHAINPVIFIQLALRIGWGYLLMYFFLVLLFFAPAALAQFAFKILPPELTIFLYSLGENYYTIISYHLMGYVILQYHRNIGYKIDFEDFRDSPGSKRDEKEEAGSELLSKINFMFKEGRHDEALILIQEEDKKNGIHDLDISECYFKLLAMKNRIDEMLVYGKRHLEILVQRNEKQKACEAYKQCIEKDPEFVPVASILFKLGGWLNEFGKSKEAISTYNRLVKAFPDAPLVPRTLFRAAQIYNDRLMNPAKAETILNAIIKNYPNHELFPSIQNYLAQMKS
jgi:tetratricopeptide (TPR) repeat protein